MSTFRLANSNNEDYALPETDIFSEACEIARYISKGSDRMPSTNVFIIDEYEETVAIYINGKRFIPAS